MEFQNSYTVQDTMLKKLLKKKLVKTPKQSWAKKFQDLNTDVSFAVQFLISMFFTNLQECITTAYSQICGSAF